MRILLLAAALLLAGCTTPAESEATLTVVHGDGTEMSDSLTFDANVFPSESLYMATGQTHAGSFTAHDLLVLWSESAGIAVTGSFSQYGYFIESIGGEAGYSSEDFTSGAYWGLEHNGESASVGVSTLEIVDGDSVTFRFTTY